MKDKFYQSFSYVTFDFLNTFPGETELHHPPNAFLTPISICDRVLIKLY
ncbi:hypothetical protein V512_001205 [Mesotoga sp. Brook.08.105.5.1]|nr:hypothetical protein V512_001205 [Mesotoga sp. Brook.08.105.5.1]RAO98117.1 hypothetical protein M388_07220 [Mesotoga sp. Brook.08.YT.4.2.5.4.]